MDSQDAVRMDHDVAFTDLEVCARCAWLRVSLQRLLRALVMSVCPVSKHALVFSGTKFVNCEAIDIRVGVQSRLAAVCAPVRGRASLDACLS